MPGFLSNLLDKAADRLDPKKHHKSGDHPQPDDRAHPPPLPDRRHTTFGSGGPSQQPQHEIPPPIPGNKPTRRRSSAASGRSGRQIPMSPGLQGAWAVGQRAYWQPGLTPAIPLPTFFRHETGAHGWGNNEAQNYTDSEQNSFFADNALHILAIARRSHPDPALRYTSARLTSFQSLQRDRGVLSARITAPIAKGVWPALWLLPVDPFRWPTDGEMDIFEAWDGSATNHSCLHWGHFNGPDHDKHRVAETDLGAAILGRPLGQGFGEGIVFELAWWEDRQGRDGRLVWYIDGRPVMKARKPAGTRPFKDFRLIINVAMGGNVCGGKLPEDGTYAMTVRELALWEEPTGGWDKFERDFNEAREGHMS